MADFSATEGRIFEQCATKGRVLSNKRVPERVWFFHCLCQRERKMSKFSLNGHICASKGMDFGPNFVPVRIGVSKFCASEGRGFAVLS